MNRETSIYLDAVRFFAAFVVLLTHLDMLGNTWLWWAKPYGTEAVLIFFVLSGFVIGYVTDQRERSVSDYAINRAARICSVAFPALVATAVLGIVSPMVSHVAPPGTINGQWAWHFLASALFVNQFWSAHIVPGSNFAFWSMSYEVTYYVAFGVAAYAATRYRLLGAVAVLAVAGPRIASLFPIWLLGLACYRACSRDRAIGRSLGWCAFIGSAMAWVVFEVWATRHGLRADAAIVPLFDHTGWDLVEDYGLALLFAAHLIGLHTISAELGPVLRRVERPIRWLAGTTFTLYLFHLPVARFLTTLLWNPDWSREVHLAVFLGTLCIVFAIAQVTERRKEPWRRGISALFASAARSFPISRVG
jgi:peptidoglycan/LPS O-acetylase OafA/YrhL